MYADQFESRLAIVRHRFATTLESKITDVVVSTDHMSRSEDGAIKVTSAALDRQSVLSPPARPRVPPKWP
jgi:hypothetical protein